MTDRRSEIAGFIREIAQQVEESTAVREFSVGTIYGLDSKDRHDGWVRLEVAVSFREAEK